MPAFFEEFEPGRARLSYHPSHEPILHDMIRRQAPFSNQSHDMHCNSPQTPAHFPNHDMLCNSPSTPAPFSNHIYNAPPTPVPFYEGPCRIYLDDSRGFDSIAPTARSSFSCEFQSPISPTKFSKPVVPALQPRMTFSNASAGSAVSKPVTPPESPESNMNHADSPYENVPTCSHSSRVPLYPDSFDYCDQSVSPTEVPPPVPVRDSSLPNRRQSERPTSRPEAEAITSSSQFRGTQTQTPELRSDELLPPSECSYMPLRSVELLPPNAFTGLPSPPARSEKFAACCILRSGP